MALAVPLSRFAPRVGGGSAFYVMSNTTRDILIAAPVIVLLLAIAIPNFLRPRVTLSENACANNLRWIQEAKVKWARDMKKTKTAVPTEDDLTPVLKVLGAGDSFPRCPAGGTYTIGPVGDPVKCSVGGPGHTLPSDYRR